MSSCIGHWGNQGSEQGSEWWVAWQGRETNDKTRLRNYLPTHSFDREKMAEMTELTKFRPNRPRPKEESWEWTKSVEKEKWKSHGKMTNLERGARNGRRRKSRFDSYMLDGFATGHVCISLLLAVFSLRYSTCFRRIKLIFPNFPSMLTGSRDRSKTSVPPYSRPRPAIDFPYCLSATCFCFSNLSSFPSHFRTYRFVFERIIFFRLDLSNYAVASSSSISNPFQG